MNLGLLGAALAASLLLTPVHAIASTQCSSNCSQKAMSCNMTCQGNQSCFKSCGDYLKNCTKACTGSLQSDNSLNTPMPSLPQEPSKAPDELHKINKFIDAIQGVIGDGK